MTDLRTHLFRLWFRLSRPMTLGARAVVEDQDGRVLLVRHTYAKGLYLPGGGVERGETVHETVRKELREEGGVHLLEDAVQMGIYSNHRIMKNDHVVLFRVAATAWEPCGDPVGREISELIWCDPLAPPDEATPATKRRLQEVFGSVPRAEHW
ncbi:MAG: NUDIX domain-containing protein [Pseudomonadota bacterium]